MENESQIKPDAPVAFETYQRLDLGFALKDIKATWRLIDTGGFAKKDRITHRIPITSVKDIDDEVKRWLKHAYELDA
jgi:hypothetical protein